ncbi:unnamed protein product [Rotaria sordida]|uniref:Uncharacterized protein n=1 Tax=Rotaria sordida TaxID=392033 RepID=A0A814MT14_9BILA|nr:unnamed protein product [Rotaria sordida]
MSLSSPGPRNRGNCYFFGQISSSTTMWQTIYLNNTVAAVLIDSLTVNFRLSAWIGVDGSMVLVTRYTQPSPNRLKLSGLVQ